MAKAAANAALTRFEEQFKKTFGDVITRSDEIKPYEVISTGSLELDYKLGVGGYVEGRLVEVWGPEGIGKTTLCLIALAEAQRKHPDKVVGYIDMEQKLDKLWAKAHGVDLARMFIVQPHNAEEVADQMKKMVSSGLFSMVVLDSIGAMIPQKEIEKEADEATVGDAAKIVTRMVKIAAVEAHKSGTIVIFINQIRANIGYGADTTTSGGWALKYCSTHKLKLRRTSKDPLVITIGGEKHTIGFEIAVQVERNNVAPPKLVANISMTNQTTSKFGPIGIDKASEATTLGIRTKVIAKAGKWYTLPSGEKFDGEENLIEAVRSQPAMISEIREKALATIAETVVLDEDYDPLAEIKGAESTGPKFKTAATREDD